MSGRRAALAFCAVQVVGLAAAWLAWVPPAGRGPDAPADRFSAARARSVLERLMADERPHPTGSDENYRVRERIVAELERLGLVPEVQPAFVCGAFRHYCGQVQNVVARLRGQDPSRAILLNAHHDTMPASPGAADCMAGVASVIETARALMAGEPPGTDVILLFNDGEEIGLLGATAFVERHPWARDVSAVINLEARGSAGPSVPAYTTGDDRILLARHLATARRPAPGSAFLAITRFLPLTNDLAVFERLSVPGVTFGFVRNPRHYHTPRDELARLSDRSLQQHGENALGLARAWMHGAPASGGGRAAFVGIGPWAVAWPVGWTLPFSCGVLAAWVLLGVALARRGRLRVPAVACGVACVPLAVVVAFFGAATVNHVRKSLTESPNAMVSQPLPTFAGFCLVGLALVALVALLLKRRLSETGGWYGVWLVWAALAVLLAQVEARAAYLLLAPAVVALGCGLLELRQPREAHATLVASAVPAAFVTVLWYPHLAWLLDLAGLGPLPPIAGLVAIAATAGVPLVRRGAGPVIAALLLAGLGLVAVGTRLPTFTADHPQYANLIYHVDAQGAARWTFTGSPLPPPLAATGGFGETWTRTLEWAPQDAGLSAEAPALALAAPRFAPLSVEPIEGGLRVRGRVVSTRGAPVVVLVFDASSGVTDLTLDGQSVPPDEAAYPLFADGFDVTTIWTTPAEGIEVAWTQPEHQPVRWTLADRSWELPPEGQPLAQARGRASVPSGLGDSTVVSVVVETP